MAMQMQPLVSESWKLSEERSIVMSQFSALAPPLMLRVRYVLRRVAG